LVDGKKTDIEYPFEHGEVIHYTLDGVSIHPVTTKLPERKETAQGFHQATKTSYRVRR
jgi:hypothetical protein